MTQTAFRTDPLSPELNHLINDYPRDALDAHQNYSRSTQNWLGAQPYGHHTWKDSFSPNYPALNHGLRQVWTCLRRITKYWITHWIALPARPIILHDKLRG